MIQVLLSRITPTLTETTVPGSLGTAKKRIEESEPSIIKTIVPGS